MQHGTYRLELSKFWRRVCSALDPLTFSFPEPTHVAHSPSILASCHRPGEACPLLTCEWCQIKFHRHCIEQMARSKKPPIQTIEVACASCARKVGSLTHPELDAEPAEE
jgi:hypothetical protein